MLRDVTGTGILVILLFATFFVIFVIDTAAKGGMTVFSMKILACETFYPTCHSEDAAWQATLTCMENKEGAFSFMNQIFFFLT